MHAGRLLTEDDPLLLANRKAKQLNSLLLHQSVLSHICTYFLEPLIVLLHIVADEQGHLPVLSGKPILVILAMEWAHVLEA